MKLTKTLQIVGAVALLALGTMAVIDLEQETVGAQSVQRFTESRAFTKLEVYPQNDDTTNAMTVWDKTGTNGFQISPTLATPAVIISNNVYSAVVYTNFIITNTAGATHIITVRNGLITSYQ